MGDLDDSGPVEVSGQPGGPEGSGTVLTPLQPMSPQRQALLSSRCYQLSEADCWDLPVDYTKIKRLGEEPEHKEVTGRKVPPGGPRPGGLLSRFTHTPDSREGLTLERSAGGRRSQRGTGDQLGSAQLSSG